MTRLPTKRAAKIVAARDLPTVVEKAIEAAGRKVSISGIGKDGIVVRWDLVGRIVRDLAGAQKFADAVTKEVKRGGIEASPAVLVIDKKILAGFFEKTHLPQIRQL